MFYFCKLRCDGHRLPEETGRWHNGPRADRLCHLCDSDDKDVDIELSAHDVFLE